MRYILDSSVALKWFLTETDSAQALAIRDDFAAGRHELVSPDVYPVEVAHSLTRAERTGRITQAEGMLHLKAMLWTLPSLAASLPLLPEAYRISSQARIGVYDCLYIALAEREGCDLLTADDRLKRSLPSSPITLLGSLS